MQLSSQRKNPIRRPLGCNRDIRRGIAGHHAREDTSIHDEQIISAVDLGIGIHHRRAARSSVVGAHFASPWLIMVSR